MAAEISAKIVKELRDKTSAGMMDCKKALYKKQMEILQKQWRSLEEKGTCSTAADKKSGRIAC